MDGMLVSEFDGYQVESIGLLKEDVLATKELAKLGAVISIINDTYGKSLSMEHIAENELEDRKTYELLARGHTQNISSSSPRKGLLALLWTCSRTA
jgi:DNA polymerase-3 subunit alpha